MIRNKDRRVNQIANIIRTRIADINKKYRQGPSLYFYHRVREFRNQHAHIASFLSCDMCVEILYATLVSWDMNSRGAKMKAFAEFKRNLLDNTAGFQAVEAGLAAKSREHLIDELLSLYDSLDLMLSKSKFVSNSKCLHFVFPSLCLPMDRENALKKLYGHTMPSRRKFLEILELARHVIEAVDNPKQYLDEKWNTCEMKLVDNAIILMRSESVTWPNASKLMCL